MGDPVRLLILLPFAPRQDAAHGGGRVVAEFLTRMTARHQVAVLYLRRSDEPGADDFFRARCHLLEEVVQPVRKNSLRHRILRYLQVSASLIQRRPLWVTDWTSKAFAEQVRMVIQTFQPDVIQAEYHVMGQYLSLARDLPRVLVQYEPGVRAASFIQNLPSLLNGIVYHMEKISWRRYEAQLYREVNAVVVFTEADRTVVEAMAGQTPIHLIPPGTAIPERPLDPLGGQTSDLLFIGNFIHPPNAEAARRLVESIFPLVQKYIPGVRLVIVGDNPPQAIQSLRSDSILITGRVPDVRPYLEQSALFVAPLHQGGGIRIKVMEALAAGKAIVTTPLAAQGLNLVDGEQISIARNDREFAERIVYLLEHPEERNSLAARARAWACANLGWDQNIQSYEALWQEVLLSES